MLGDLNSNIQAHNPHSQQVGDILTELGLVDLRQHFGSTGSSNTFNVVLDLARHVVVDKI